jgi:hypothetical protein
VINEAQLGEFLSFVNSVVEHSGTFEGFSCLRIGGQRVDVCPGPSAGYFVSDHAQPPHEIPDSPGAPGRVPTVAQLADIPEEEIWLSKHKSARTRRAYRLDVQHFMRSLSNRDTRGIAPGRPTRQ